MNRFIKNIEHEKTVKLTDLISISPGQVVSRTPVSYTHLDVYKRQI